MRFLALLALVVAVVAHAPVSSARGNQSTKTMRLTALEAALVREVNKVRVEHGLRRLRGAPRLRTAARSHTKAMLDFGYFGHESVDGTTVGERIKRYYSSRGWHSWSVGEALMATQGGTAEPSAVVATWMSSPPHRKILLLPSWKDLGIGALYAPAAPGAFGNTSTIAVTADFGLRVGR